MTDNFNLIEPLLAFPKGDDSFYFLQILQRKKDHPGKRLGGSNNNSRLIKAYYINTPLKLRTYEEEIKTLCDVFHARASINLNPRSFQKTAFRLLSKIAAQMENKDFFNARKAYDSVCGEYQAEMDKRWLVDIDDPRREVTEEVDSYINGIHIGMEQKYKEKDPNQLVRRTIATIPSKNGFHIITPPFNPLEFSKKYNCEIHKNNPTNLYIP